MTASCIPIYEFSLNLRFTLEAHSLSNIGSNGTNRLLGRRILRANGDEADAISGNLLKHGHAMLTAEYLLSFGEPLCAACAIRDGRRAAGLSATEQREGHPVAQCGLCDIHGYLIIKRANEVTAENKDIDEVKSEKGTAKGKRKSKDQIEHSENSENEAQTRHSKASLVEFSFAISDPTHQAETRQLFTRMGEGRDGGQMLVTMPNRSGDYAKHVRYRAAGIGTDTYTWRMIVLDPARRLARHRAVLSALRDQVLSPGGARTASMLPHFTSLAGAICIRHTVGRAPIYSGLDPHFVERLQGLKIADLTVYPFDNIEAFNEVMETLITNSVPAEIAVRSAQ